MYEKEYKTSPRTFRQKMMENNENLSWCRPLFFQNGIAIALNEGKVAGIRMNGEDLEITEANISAVAEIICGKGMELADLLEADFEEGPCRECPWFGNCEAMDLEVAADAWPPL